MTAGQIIEVLNELDDDDRVYFKDDKEIKNYEPLCETRKRICNCIGVVKQQAGIDRNDFSWHFKDEEERESAYSR